MTEQHRAKTNKPANLPILRWEILVLILITLLAAALRFYRLPTLPPGLHYDEAFYGVIARGILEGEPLRVFYPDNQGVEPLIIYLVAIATGLFGQISWVERLPSVVTGILTVPAVWWLARELFNSLLEQDKDNASLGFLALAAALIVAVLYWHITFSRIGMEPILIPFFTALGFAALLRGLNTEKWGWFFAAGGILAGNLYSYRAGYFVPILAVAFVGYAILIERDFLRKHWKHLLLAAGGALLVFTPMLIFIATNPDMFFERSSQVAVTGDSFTVISNLPDVLGMFFIAGDADPRSNLPGRPALDPFLGLLFIFGLLRSITQWRRTAAMLPVIWLVVMTIPTLVTGFAPHFGRSIGTIPAIALLCAAGGWAIRVWVTQLKAHWLKPALIALFAGGILYSTITAACTYFVIWPQTGHLFYAYEQGLAEVAQFINTVPVDQEVYLTPRSDEHYTLQYIVNRNYKTFDGRAGMVFAPQEDQVTYIVLPGEDAVTLPALWDVLPHGEESWTLTDDNDQPYAIAYAVPANNSPIVNPDNTASGTAGDFASLTGYSTDISVAHPGETLTLVMYWEALDTAPQNYTVFTHLLDSDGNLIAGHDSEPLGYSYPTTRWTQGELILDTHWIAIPANIAPGEYTLQTGMYLLETLERVPVVDANQKPQPDKVIRLGIIEVVN